VAPACRRRQGSRSSPARMLLGREGGAPLARERAAAGRALVEPDGPRRRPERRPSAALPGVAEDWTDRGVTAAGGRSGKPRRRPARLPHRQRTRCLARETRAPPPPPPPRRIAGLVAKRSPRWSSTAAASEARPRQRVLGTDWAQGRELCRGAAPRTRGLAGIIRRPEPSVNRTPHRTGRWGPMFCRIWHPCRDFSGALESTPGTASSSCGDQHATNQREKRC
jgi:hypothetical protein